MRDCEIDRQAIVNGTNQSVLHAYCLFCETGFELDIARECNARFQSLEAIAVLKQIHKIVNGKRESINTVLLPGYVFLFTKEETIPANAIALKHVLRLLKYDEDLCALIGSDRKYAMWIYENNGLLKTSKAVMIGDEDRMIDGPLSHIPGKIVKIDQHRRNAKVEMIFDKSVWTTWLSFDWL